MTYSRILFSQVWTTKCSIPFVFSSVYGSASQSHCGESALDKLYLTHSCPSSSFLISSPIARVKQSFLYLSMAFCQSIYCQAHHSSFLHHRGHQSIVFWPQFTFRHLLAFPWLTLSASPLLFYSPPCSSLVPQLHSSPVICKWYKLEPNVGELPKRLFTNIKISPKGTQDRLAKDYIIVSSPLGLF